MKQKKKQQSLDELLWKMREIGKQLEALGSLIRFHDPAVGFTPEESTGVAGILEQLGRRVRWLNQKIESDWELSVKRSIHLASGRSNETLIKNPEKELRRDSKQT